MTARRIMERRWANQKLAHLLFVRIKGLEPPRLSASDPKSDVATNYTISAVCSTKVVKFGNSEGNGTVFL